MVSHPWLRVDSSRRGRWQSFWRMSVKVWNTWPCLTLIGVSVARSSEVHVRTLLERTVCCCWSIRPHIWATCVLKTESPNETHTGTQKCCVCTCIPGIRRTGWQKRGGLSRLKWYSENNLMDISSLWFYFFLNRLDALLLCLLSVPLHVVTVVWWQRAAVSHSKRACSALVSDQSLMPNTSHELKLITLCLIFPI